jgi:hypothetical protein
MVSWVRVPRRPDWPWWSVALVVAWGGLVATAVYLEQRTGYEVSLCLFRRITGHPCLTCGSTRAVLCLVSGEVLQALAHNPLVMLGLVLITLNLALRLALGRQLQLDLSPLQRKGAWVLAFVAALSNWAYLIVSGR